MTRSPDSLIRYSFARVLNFFPSVEDRSSEQDAKRKRSTHLKKSDPVLAAIIERIGPFRMQFGEPTFHSLAESILYQQLNGKAAATIFDRFTALAGDPLTPQGILKLTDARNARRRTVAAEDRLSARSLPRRPRPACWSSSAWRKCRKKK